jgi:hypothetical protein
LADVKTGSHHRGYQPRMVHAFYGVRTGFIRRGGVNFFSCDA